MLQVVFHPKAKKELLKLPKGIRLKILDQLAVLEQKNHPLQHSRVLKLSSSDHKNFRLRVGSYRVKLTLRDTHTVLVTRVQHRQAGY